jgi:cobalt-zinc-cadmium efflux system membrane fusion protein
MVTIPPDSPQLSQVKVEQVGTADVPENEVVAPGRIEFDVARIGRVLLPVSGRVDQVLVRLGDSVSAGQSLFTVDSPEADAVLSEFRQAQAAISQARSSLAKAKADHERAADLFEHKAIAKKEVLASENDLAQTKAALDQAEAACEHARRKIEILGLGGEKAEKKVTVKAPLSGKVIDLSITAGEYHNDTTTPVMTVADLSTVWVTSAVPENAIRLIDVGESVEVELVAYPGEIFEARVKRIADTLDPKTRTVQVRAELANPGGKFRPEMFGRIRHSHSKRTVPVVPARAILRRGAETILYVERGRGKFERVPVVIGPARGDRVPVLVGIKTGDRVVVDGVMLLAGVEAQ